MTRTIAERLVESAGRGFVGRRRELAALRDALAAVEPPFLAAFVHGPGGIGKTRLLHAVLTDPPAGIRPILLDGRDMEPTPRGMRLSLARALGAAPETAAIVSAIAADPRRTVIAVDTYEVLGLLDSWLRTTFLPTLPATVLTVLAGRDRPSDAWHTAPGWSGLVAEFPLAALSDDDAVALLRARGLAGERVRRANEFAHGHPLALELAAASLRSDPGAVLAPAGLVDAFLGQLPAEAVVAVEAASTVRRVTEPILQAVLATDDVTSAFATLRALPFTEPGADGLLLHDVVRDTVGRDLAVRDPDVRRDYRRRAARYFTERASAERADLWQVTADLMFLIDNPVVRDACFPSSRPQFFVEPARPEDATADPVARPWREHLRAAPPAPDEQVLLMRRWLGRESGELRSPPVSACWLDVKRVYMELRPRLRRLYSTVVDLPQLGPIFLPLGFAPVGAPVDVDGSLHQGVWLDFGPGSVDGWLGRLVDAETRPESGPAPAPPRTDLSGRELEVLDLLARGRTNRGIGAQLFISEKTAGRHVSNIFLKLDVHTRAEAARIAVEQGLLQHPGHEMA